VTSQHKNKEEISHQYMSADILRGTTQKVLIFICGKN